MTCGRRVKACDDRGRVCPECGHALLAHRQGDAADRAGSECITCDQLGVLEQLEQLLAGVRRPSDNPTLSREART